MQHGADQQISRQARNLYVTLHFFKKKYIYTDNPTIEKKKKKTGWCQTKHVFEI